MLLSLKKYFYSNLKKKPKMISSEYINPPRQREAVGSHSLMSCRLGLKNSLHRECCSPLVQ